MALASVMDSLGSRDSLILEQIRGCAMCVDGGEICAITRVEHRPLAKLLLKEISVSPFPIHLLPNAYLAIVPTTPTKLIDLSVEPPGDPIDAWIILATSAQHSTVLVDALSRQGALRSDLNEAFSMPHGRQVIGQGACSTVLRMNKPDGTDVAVKDLFARVDSAAIEQEVAMLIECQNHDHIVVFLGIFWRFEETVRLSLAFEMMKHGDLLREVIVSGRIPEKRSQRLWAGVIAGLLHIHSFDIVHRDVKTENILLRSLTCAVIADFGLATKISDKNQMERRCGTPGYVAPEVYLRRQYGAKVDLFGSGVALFFALSQEMPFTGQDQGALAMMKCTLKCELDLRRPPFDTMTRHLRDFLRQLMAKHESKRLSSHEALAHSWFVRGRREPPYPTRLASISDDVMMSAELGDEFHQS
jgi:serine/threonine protein kinase